MSKNSNIQQGEANKLRKLGAFIAGFEMLEEKRIFLTCPNESCLLSTLMKACGLGCDIVRAALEGDEDIGIVK